MALSNEVEKAYERNKVRKPGYDEAHEQLDTTIEYVEQSMISRAEEAWTKLYTQIDKEEGLTDELKQKYDKRFQAMREDLETFEALATELVETAFKYSSYRPRGQSSPKKTGDVNHEADLDDLKNSWLDIRNSLHDEVLLNEVTQDIKEETGKPLKPEEYDETENLLFNLGVDTSALRNPLYEVSRLIEKAGPN